jgi:hypothetical protein
MAYHPENAWTIHEPAKSNKENGNENHKVS